MNPKLKSKVKKAMKAKSKRKPKKAKKAKSKSKSMKKSKTLETIANRVLKEMVSKV